MAVPTAAIWALLVLANGFSIWGVLRIRTRTGPAVPQAPTMALAVGLALELAAITLLFLRYTRRL
jgi:hypothetical protein